MTKWYGLTVEDINWSCPADLEPYSKAYGMEQRHNDSLAWMYCGNYMLSAVSVAIEHCLSKKAKSEYIKVPVMQKVEDEIPKNKYKESQEEIAVYEMKQRINELRKQGLPESPM